RGGCHSRWPGSGRGRGGWGGSGRNKPPGAHVHPEPRARRRCGRRPPAASRRANSMPDRAFWNGRRVLLTGHTGFKGSWLSLWLHALGAEVTGYALEPPTRPNLFEQAGVAAVVHSEFADIRDFSRLKAAIGACRPDVVIHMAAQSVVLRGYEDPLGTYSSNVIGTLHVLEALRQL